MDKEDLLQLLINEVAIDKEINLADIPEIELYMDQITTLFENKLGHLKRNDKDAILTKTMINNYTKAKILLPPNKKKYSKDHIILLIMIYNLKQVLSINDIEMLFSFVNEQQKNDEKVLNIEEIYRGFLDIKQKEVEGFDSIINDRLEAIKEKTKIIGVEKQSDTELLLLVLSLINQANLNKRLAEKIIDNYFKKEEPKKVKK